MDSLPESTITAFKHETLPDAANHVRLLEVLDDNYSDTIRVRCRITTWSSDSLPLHHAISYAWGDPRSKTTILLNDKPCQVGTNCEFVLKQAYWHAKSRYYWIDAICVDQGNLNEKSKQVAMMGTIYKRAEHVWTCVGEHADDSLFLFRHLLFELKNARQTTLLCGRGAVPRDEFHVMLCVFGYHLQRKAKKPIWKLSSSVFRSDATRSGRLSRIYKQLSPKTLAGDFTENDLMIDICVVLLDEDVSPQGLIQLSTQLRCTIPRDKVYGIMSLLDSGDNAPIIPDYTKSEIEVALDLLHAIWNNEFVQKQESSSECQLFSVCAATIQNLGSHCQDFPGVQEALEARGSPPEGALKEAEIGPTGSLPPAPSLAIGCRISLGDLIQGDDVRFKSWNPPGTKKTKMFLPFWTREGDWVVHMKDLLQQPKYFLVLREEASNSPLRIVGHGYCASSGFPDLVGTAFQLLWDPEDVLIFTLISLVLRQRTEHDDEWMAALNTGICRPETPGSSYGIKLPQA